MLRKIALLLRNLSVGSWDRSFAVRYLVMLFALFGVVQPSQSEAKRSDDQRQQSAPLGGTVNIYLANRNGIVAVTDSMLSSGGVPVAYGVKLFQVDDHTICSIAGWYSYRGPTVDGVNFAAYEAIPAVINTLIVQNDRIRSWTLEEKLNFVSSGVAFMLEAVDDMVAPTGGPANTEPSQITMASAEGGVMKIARTDVKQSLVGGKVVYQLFPQPTRTIGDGLTYWLAGRTSVGERILSNSLADSGGDIPSPLKEQVSKDSGKSLSLLGLQQIAMIVEQKTSASEPTIVGGPVQIATIEKGLAHLVEQPLLVNTESDPFPTIAKLMSRARINGGAVGLVVVGSALLVKDSNLTNVRYQQLDRIFFFNTTFDHCALFYGGSSTFFFDRSNTVTDSTLKLGPGVDPDSPAINRIRADFPQLKIISSHHPGT